MTYLRSLFASTAEPVRWVMVAGVSLVSLLLVASLLWLVVMGDGTSDPVPYTPREVTSFAVCPSILDGEPSRLRRTRKRVGELRDLCSTTADVEASPCTGELPPGVVEVRRRGDNREGYQVDFSAVPGHAGAVYRGAFVEGPNGSGVIYLETPVLGPVLMHELGHAVGYGHTPRASSYMYEGAELGSYPSGMDRCVE